MIAPLYRYRARLDRVIDGDTVVLDVDLGFRTWRTIYVRVAGVDTPERGRKGYALARERTLELLEDADDIVIVSHEERTFDRWVCRVYTDRGSLADMLVQEGLGKAA